MYASSFSISRTGDKRRKLTAVVFFTMTMAVDFVLLASIFGISIAFSSELWSQPIDDKTRGDIACFLDHGESCTGCEQTADRRCKEWSSIDVVLILQNQAKTSATLAAIFFLHAFGALRFGFVMMKHIATYQIEYV